MVRLKGIVKLFGTENGRTVRALDGLSMDIRQGELLVLMGPNGSGKSTTFRILDGQLTPDAGAVDWNTLGQGVLTSNGTRPLVVHVPQEPRSLAFPDMTLEEHMLWTELSGQRPRFWRRGITHSRRNKYRGVLEQYQVGTLAEALGSPLRTLSVGWQQIFIILLAAVGHTLADNGQVPQLLLLDEPTSSLDVENTRLCLDLIGKLHKEGRTIVLATHDAALALEMGERVCIMKRGQLVQELSIKEARERGVDALRQAVGEAFVSLPNAS